MANRLDDKVFIITGAGSGIGRATSIKLASLGAILSISDIDITGLEETLDLCGKTAKEKALSRKCDISSSQSCYDFVKLTVATLGRIDHVFNCAGVNPTKLTTADITDEYWDKLVNTNLKGLFNMTRACIPHMQPGSSFVNVASTAGLRAMDGYAVYCATKWGVIGFSKCMALELGPKGIKVNIVAPGYIDTPTNAVVVEGKESMEAAAQNITMKRMGTAEEVADVVAFLFSDESRYMNGSVVEIHGGLA